ncbi:unnamed protein product [Trifolium pratense]|uniref:Uncharacterized protein n=1 Tax=Trifolium pratense TaxID=57577 RepID=A0ACB0J0M4_TRIPR|nr:unnamed protein product [Trifolium pratense]
MKTKSLIFTLFLWELILFSVVSIESSKDENQFGVIEESKTKIGIDGWRDWGNWIGWGRGGDKEGKQNGSERDKRSRYSGGGWRTWGHYKGLRGGSGSKNGGPRGNP